MLAQINSSVVIGIDAHTVDVEVDISSGLPSFSIVGLPDAAVKESRDRVKAALKNCSFSFPSKKITVNLAPATLKKEGSIFDLPIAVGILVATSQVEPMAVADKVFVGELSLDGKLRPINGALSISLSLVGNNKKLLIPEANADEASLVRQIPVISIKTLVEAVRILKGEINMEYYTFNKKSLEDHNQIEQELDFSDVKGQFYAKRGIEVATAGGHNVLMIGPPGSGKTMLARRIPTVLSDMSMDEALVTTKIHSVAGLLRKGSFIVTKRPFRTPHHTTSYAGLVGGGQYPKPGEISLAHNGVLFLDELPEFRRDALEALRQPIEDGVIAVCRVSGSLVYPARFMLVAAMNPCPCGFLTDPRRPCHCTPPQIQRYLSKISGPLLDRIDIHLDVPAVKYKDLTSRGSCETSDQIRKRIITTRKRQIKRYRKIGISLNSELEAKHLEEFCQLDKDAQDLLKVAILQMGLSARAYDKILKVARTIADLAEKEMIEAAHISEAIGYRSLDRNLWM